MQNILAMRFHGKAIPYPPHPGPRPDGSQNFGFRDVKRKPSEVDAIPELANDPSLRSLVHAISKNECGLFSVGCLSGDEHSAAGHNVTGYIEFGINSKELIVDAVNYFKLFVEFQTSLIRSRDARAAALDVSLVWEIDSAGFVEIDDLKEYDAYTCAIVVNTAAFTNSVTARECWTGTLGVLESFLGSCPVARKDLLY